MGINPATRYQNFFKKPRAPRNIMESGNDKPLPSSTLLDASISHGEAEAPPSSSEKLTSVKFKILFLVIAFYCGIFLPRYASNISNYFFEFGSSAWDFSHHILQMVFALIIIILLALFTKTSIQDWGFNLNNSRWSLRTVGKFCIGYAIILPIGTIINQILLGWPNLLWFDLTWGDFFRTFAFSVTMPGISEEIVFRAMVMGILSFAWEGKIMIGKVQISHANLIAAGIFAFAHVYFTLDPFAIVYYNIMQLAFAFFLGLFYGVMFEKTKSLLGPILAHNASDGLAVIIYTLIALIFS